MKMITLNNLIKVDQGSNGDFEFWITSINSKELMGEYHVNRIAEDPTTGVQRFLNETRASKIAEYCKQKDAIFPTPIIVSLNSDLIDGNFDRSATFTDSINILSWPHHPLENEQNTLLPFSIIDGQHRLEGLKKYYSENPGGKSFQIPLIIYLDADQAKSASIFVTINANQRSVDSSTISELFGIIFSNNPEVYTVESFCSRVVNILNDSSYSPFYKKIKILGRKNKPEEFISQGTVAKKIHINITSNSQKDNLALEKKRALPIDNTKVFREQFIRNDAVGVANTLIEFFSAFAYSLPEIWDDNRLLAKKAVGFSALMKYLSLTIQCARAHGDIFSYYSEVFILGKKNCFIDVIKEKFSSDRGSSESIAKQICDEMFQLFPPF